MTPPSSLLPSFPLLLILNSLRDLLAFFLFLNFSSSKSLHRSDGTVQILTKGDNNQVDDSFGIYARGQQFLGREHIIGRAKAYVTLSSSCSSLFSSLTPLVRSASSPCSLVLVIRVVYCKPRHTYRQLTDTLSYSSTSPPFVPLLPPPRSSINIFEGTCLMLEW